MGKIKNRYINLEKRGDEQKRITLEKSSDTKAKVESGAAILKEMPMDTDDEVLESYSLVRKAVREDATGRIEDIQRTVAKDAAKQYNDGIGISQDLIEANISAFEKYKQLASVSEFGAAAIEHGLKKIDASTKDAEAAISEMQKSMEDIETNLQDSRDTISMLLR